VKDTAGLRDSELMYRCKDIDHKSAIESDEGMMKSISIQRVGWHLLTDDWEHKIFV